MSGPTVAAVIPALDEEGSIAAVVGELLERGVAPVVVGDNGSTDDTARIAARAGALVASAPRRGYGRACLAALRRLEHEPSPVDVVLFVDGDGADELACIPELVRPIADGRADLAIGRRQAAPGAAVGNARPHARIGTRWVLRAARLLHGLDARDMGPFRAIRRETLAALRMDDPTWGWTLQMQLRAHHHGSRTVEVPVPRRRRTAGRSKVSGSASISVRAGLRMGYTLLREWWRARGPGSRVRGSSHEPRPEA